MKNPAPAIAVVDDESAVRTALRRLLRLAGFEVTTFDSGEDFVASLAGSRPDCVLLDLHMPGISGLELLRLLCERQVEIPVICITASDDIALDDQVLRAGGMRLLRKPFSGDELVVAVRQALQP